MRSYIFIAIAFTVSLFSCSKNDNSTTLKNGTATIQVVINTDNEGHPYFISHHNNELILDTSYLGMVLEGVDLSKGLKIRSINGPEKIVDSYELYQGKQKNIIYKADRYTISFINNENIPFECIFDLGDNSIAYRYQLSKAIDSPVKIISENSSFGFHENTVAWMQPMSVSKTGWRETNPSYEEHYMMEVPVDTRSPLQEGFVFPALFKVNDSWIVLSETDVHADYCGSHLKYNDALGSLAIEFPQKTEVFTDGKLLPNGDLPLLSPWRIISIGTLKEVTESTLGTDLAAPSIVIDKEFIKGGFSSWSWVLLKDDFTNYETSHRFIDYASEMNWPYCLIDADWDWKIGYERMQELVDYANSKNVKVLLWYNSSGDWNSTTYSPKSKLLSREERRNEFARLQEMGVAGCKIDFFGGDGQSMMEYYHDIMQDAADHDLLLNFHGATLPRGWQRTYPNLMTVEAIKGQEFITFEQVNADLQPSHCAVIPFTRNVYDPMDFTPMVLDSIPGIHRKTTSTFELALPVLFTSGIQHIAEIPEGMIKASDKVVDYLKDIPTLWDETVFIDGYPGKDVIMARRKGTTWFVVGINSENTTKEFSFKLPFETSSSATLFYDGSSDFPESKEIEISGPFKLDTKPMGGFVMKISN